MRMKKIGKATVSSRDTMHLPKSVINYFGIRIGDILEFYPPETDFSAKETEDLIAVFIRRMTATAEYLESLLKGSGVLR